jgi:hypothetical protein
VSAVWQKLFWGLLSPDGKPFKPNAAQEPIIREFEAGNRLILICGGERSGKSLTASAILGLVMGPELNATRRKRYWIIGPDYRQCRPEFLYVYDALERGGLVEKASLPQSETMPWSLETQWGTVLETRSASDVMKLASFTVDGIVIAEAGQQTEETYRKALGRVAETRGFILMVGTLEDGLPWYEEYLRRWATSNPEGGRSFSMPTWSNLDVFPGGRDDPEIQRLIASLPNDYVAHRFAAEPVRRQNLVVPEFDYRTHVRVLSPNPDLPVELAVDPGKNAYAVVFVQHEGAFTYVLDCIYTRGEIAQQVIPRVMAHRLWNQVSREPSAHVMDIAGFAEAGTESQFTIWRDATGLIFTGRYQKEKDTIAVVRSRLMTDPVLGLPLIQFSDRMRTGIAPDGTATEMLSEFDLWRWPKRGFNSSEADKPVDANNHALKALGYKLLIRYGMQRDARKRSTAGVKRESWNPAAGFFSSR